MDNPTPDQVLAELDRLGQRVRYLHDMLKALRAAHSREALEVLQDAEQLLTAAAPAMQGIASTGHPERRFDALSAMAAARAAPRARSYWLLASELDIIGGRGARSYDGRRPAFWGDLTVLDLLQAPTDVQETDGLQVADRLGLAPDVLLDSLDIKRWDRLMVGLRAEADRKEAHGGM